MHAKLCDRRWTQFPSFYFISLIIDFLWNKKVVAFNLSRLNYQLYNAYDSTSLAHENHFFVMYKKYSHGS